MNEDNQAGEKERDNQSVSMGVKKRENNWPKKKFCHVKRKSFVDWMIHGTEPK